LIDPRAVVSPQAELAQDVEVGPFAVIGPGVEIGAGTRVGAHAVIEGPTRIGRDNRLYPFCAIGGESQDKKYRGEEARLEIGDRNTIREYCTINRGTAGGGGVTRIGNDCWIMAYCHIAHDCVIGDHVTMANNTTLAGHVLVEDYAGFGGFSKVHQFCRVGAHSFCGMDSGLTRDLPTYVLAAGYMAVPKGVNAEGLQRRGFTSDQIRHIRNAYKILYRSGLKLGEAVERLAELAREQPEIVPLVDFLRASERSIIR
jgi:UDP-N-acetylglucosamine acyltransferase